MCATLEPDLECKWSSTPLQMRSSGSPVGCCILLKRLWGRGSLWEGSMADLDGYGNGQTHYTALYSSLPFPVVPSDCPLKDKLKRAVYRPLPWSPTPHPFITATSKMVLRSTAVSLDVSPQATMFALSAGIQRVFLWKALCDLTSASANSSAAFFYSTVATASLWRVFCGDCNQIVSIRGL